MMSVSRERLGWLLNQMVAESAAVREQAAEVVGDWETSLSALDKRLVVRVLPLLVTAEKPGPVRESQLNAMVDIFLPPYATRGDVDPVFEIPEESLTMREKEHVDALREIIAEFPKLR